MELVNRRYIGSKAKLLDWIFLEINKNTKGKSFFDVFAGTGSVAERALYNYEEVIINDFLFSNKVIYDALWLNDEYDINKIKRYKKKFNDLNDNLSDNYFSENFGNKYFGINDSIKIGIIRENIEDEFNKKNINKREYKILLASLIYSIDKIANTVGHYEAYRKDKVKDNLFVFKLLTLKQYPASKIKIYRKDANELVKRIGADVVFLDPPYNSRQYSRFYHLIENLIEWKKPTLYGVALKPEPQNMSDFCKSNAPIVFDDLIMNLKCKYIVVTYNNTYNSKSNSSKNKIQFEEILSSLNKRGKTKVFEKKHKYFNTGKTNFLDHKEFLFITEVINEK